MYEPFKKMLGDTDPKNTPIHIKLIAGSLSGSIGSFLAMPSDVLKVRM
jgi:solute carrier family 25 protein 14/30